MRYHYMTSLVRHSYVRHAIVLTEGYTKPSRIDDRITGVVIVKEEITPPPGKTMRSKCVQISREFKEYVRTLNAALDRDIIIGNTVEHKG